GFLRLSNIKPRPMPPIQLRVPPPPLFRPHVHLGLKPRVRRDRPRLRQHLPALDLVPLHPPEQHPNIVPRFAPIENLAKHLHPRRHRLLRRPIPHDLHRIPHINHPALHPPPPHPAPPRDPKALFHRHELAPLDDT